ncbi:MAG: DMT family transporter [Thaumarchaeota archaeon]|nr:DMT family transporter [Nitrososphaerota archaeon]
MKETYSREVRRGYLYAFLAAVCGGVIPTSSKLLLAVASPAAIASWGFLLSGLVLVPYRPKALPGRKSLPYVVLFGVLGGALGPVLYQYGLSSSTAVNASLLSNGEVLFTALIAFGLFGERLSRKQLGFGMFIVAGIVAVSTNLELSGIQFFQGLLGNLLILASTLAWSAENNLIVSATQRFGPGLITKFRNMIGGALVLLVAASLGVQVGVPSSGWVPLAALAFALAGTSFLAIAALGKIGAVRTILVFSTTSVFGAVFALVFLGEQITPVQLSGGAVILIGVYLFQRNERKPVA